MPYTQTPPHPSHLIAQDNCLVSLLGPPCVFWMPCTIPNDLCTSCWLQISLGPVVPICTHPWVECIFPVTNISLYNRSPAVLRKLLWIKASRFCVCSCVTSKFYLLYPCFLTHCFSILQRDFLMFIVTLGWTSLSCMCISLQVFCKCQQTTCSRIGNSTYQILVELVIVSIKSPTDLLEYFLSSKLSSPTHYQEMKVKSIVRLHQLQQIW